MMEKPLLLEPDVTPFWGNEEWDDLIPKNGFLYDFTLSLKGMKSSSFFCLWTGLGFFSALVKRDAFFEWYPDNLLLHLYVILVGRPSSGKSNAITRMKAVYKEMLKMMEKTDPLLYEHKRLTLVTGRMTPEMIPDQLLPQKFTKPITLPNGRIENIHVDRHSQIAFVISELTDFLGKQSYNMGLIDKLTKLFDGEVDDADLTVKNGRREFRDIYVTLLGATTFDHLTSAIPEEAFGGGFLSRVILCPEHIIHRHYPRPKEVIKDVNKKLAERLLWIVNKAQGEVKLSPEAEEYYNSWYERYDTLLYKTKDDKSINFYQRYEIKMLKVASLLRLQSYEEGNEISLTDLKLAIEIVDKTFKKGEGLFASLGADEFTKTREKIIKILSDTRDKRTIRRALMQKLSPTGVRVQTLNEALIQLYQMGEISIWTPHKKKAGGRYTNFVSDNGKELYLLGREWELSNKEIK
jgi:hypothetical protein